MVDTLKMFKEINKLIDNHLIDSSLDNFSVIIGSNPSKGARSPILWNKVYKEEKVNPLGGCLPILIQIPVFIALYWVIIESVEMRHAPFIGWIQDLSSKDPYFVLPILMGVSMFVQQKLNPPPADPTQQKIFMFLPIIFTLLFATFPSGLVLYWFINNVLSIGQQYVINKRLSV